jgi:hypothetical protein
MRGVLLGPEEECNSVAPAVVAAHPDEAEERSSAQAEESYWTDPAFWASFDAMVADHASHVTVHNKLDTPAGGNGLSGKALNQAISSRRVLLSVTLRFRRELSRGRACL